VYSLNASICLSASAIETPLREIFTKGAFSITSHLTLERSPFAAAKSCKMIPTMDRLRVTSHQLKPVTQPNLSFFLTISS
jgi:hypothetical protein